MDILLSLSTTISGSSLCPASLRASKAIPPVSAPSPITATTRPGVPFMRMARSMPSAAEMEVLEWPVLKVSNSLSSVLGKPARPFICLSVGNSAARPVNILLT